MHILVTYGTLSTPFRGTHMMKEVVIALVVSLVVSGLVVGLNNRFRIPLLAPAPKA